LFRDEELVTDAHGSVAPFADSGLYEIWLSLRPDKDPDTALRIVDEELEKLRRKPVTRAELDKVKNRMELGFLQGLETASGKAEQIGFFEIVMGDGQALFSRLDALRKVTARDIQRVATQYFDARRRTRISVVPERVRAKHPVEVSA
jgi:zinc protease